MPKSSQVAFNIPARGPGKRRGNAAACWRCCEASRGCWCLVLLGAGASPWGAGAHCGHWVKLLTPSVVRGAGISQLELIFSSEKQNQSGFLSTALP